MSNINNDNMVYIVFKGTDYINIDAVFANRESLQRYLEEERIQYEKSLNSEHLKAEIHRVKTLSEEEYEITVEVPSFNIEIRYAEFEMTGITSGNNKAKLWVANCICPSRQLKIFIREEDAKDWISNIDDPEEMNFIEKHELQF